MMDESHQEHDPGPEPGRDWADEDRRARRRPQPRRDWRDRNDQYENVRPRDRYTHQVPRLSDAEADALFRQMPMLRQPLPVTLPTERDEAPAPEYDDQRHTRDEYPEHEGGYER